MPITPDTRNFIPVQHTAERLCRNSACPPCPLLEIIPTLENVDGLIAQAIAARCTETEEVFRSIAVMLTADSPYLPPLPSAH